MNHRPSGYEPDELPTAPPRDETWWTGVDSNHRSETRQIYSLLPLATREPVRSVTKYIIILQEHFVKHFFVNFLTFSFRLAARPSELVVRQQRDRLYYTYIVLSILF